MVVSLAGDVLVVWNDGEASMSVDMTTTLPTEVKIALAGSSWRFVTDIAVGDFPGGEVDTYPGTSAGALGPEYRLNPTRT